MASAPPPSEPRREPRRGDEGLRRHRARRRRLVVVYVDNTTDADARPARLEASHAMEKPATRKVHVGTSEGHVAKGLEFGDKYLVIFIWA